MNDYATLLHSKFPLSSKNHPVS